MSRGTSTSQSDYRDRLAGDGLGYGQGANTPARLRVDRGCTKRIDDDYVCTRLHADVGRARHQSRQHTARVVQFFVHRRALFICKSGRLDRSLIGPTDPHTAGRRTDRFAALAGGDGSTQNESSHSSRLMSPHKQRIPVRRLLRSCISSGTPLAAYQACADAPPAHCVTHSVNRRQSLSVAPSRYARIRSQPGKCCRRHGGF